MSLENKDLSMTFNYQSPGNPPKHISVTYDEIHAHAKALAKELEAKGPWKGVVAVSSGGMLPAKIVARNLGIKDIPTCSITRYDGNKEGDLRIIRMPEINDKGRGWLIIDELADKGKTLRLIKKHFPEAHIATLYVKAEGKDVVDTYLSEVDQETWMHYPWEDNEPTYLSPQAILKLV